MADRLRGLLLLLFLLPLALADTALPCDGYEVLEGFVLKELDLPTQIGVEVKKVDDVEDEQTCWQRCCDQACDQAVMLSGRCHIVKCTLNGLNVCEVTEEAGARTYRRINAGLAPTQEDFCVPEKQTGDCRAYFVRWWYDVTTGTCKNFTYGGCAVNLNNYIGEEECMQRCQGVKAVKSKDLDAPSKRTVSSGSTSDLCSGPGVTGNCRAAFRRWYFDEESLTCRMFIYGGCGGSKNNHLTEQDCVSQCATTKPEPEKVHAPKKGNFQEYCAAPAFTGPCRAAFTRWFYDPSSSTCKKFIYGGCKSNSNNYMNENECMVMCSGRTEDSDFDHSVLHRPVAAVVLPILLSLLAAALIGIMILFFVKVTRKTQESAGFRAMWNPIDDKECLMNSAYNL
ncbi:kunitz-type protease inhibitor 2 [Leptodactylus fuscus]|uniref:kunitz-type protease inhibitor 2 n=1 Tax=Leptodactylus fuscus TaxID=238119 RepID=UPI003F4F30FC